MKTYISIFQGINVGGKNIIKIDALQTMYENLGFLNVRTYVQTQSPKTVSVIVKRYCAEKKSLH